MTKLGLALFLTQLILAKRIYVNSFATPNSDFLLGIDGSSIATAHEHICVLEMKAGGGIGGRSQCWGYDGHGKLQSPKDIDFIQISAGMRFTCGITLEQTVHCWGSISGQIPGLYEQISAAGFGNFACGVMTDGKVNCWGNSKVAGLINREADSVSRYVQISCSKHHCCALDSNAYPHCWGSGAVGETNPPTITYEEYLLVTQNGLGAGDLQILQQRHYQNNEEEEDFETDPATAARNRQNTDTEISKVQFRQISVGEGYSCGIELLGSHLLCWGDAKHSASYNVDKNNVVGSGQVLRSPGPYRQVSVGRKGVCAITGTSSSSDNSGDNVYNSNIRAADVLECWGAAKNLVKLDSGSSYHLDDATTAAAAATTTTTTSPLQWDQVSVGSSSICAVSMDSELVCWGHSLPPHMKVNPSKYIVA